MASHLEDPGGYSPAQAQLSARLAVETVDSLVHRWVVDLQGQTMPEQQLTAALATMSTRYLESLPGAEA